jgi:acyl-CoA thioester hydrolase
MSCSEGTALTPSRDIVALPRNAYRHFLSIPTRWMDNDAYGHVNNVTYYSYFDTAVNAHLIEAGGLDLRAAPVIGIVAETACCFHHSLTFPDVLDAGLRVVRLGTSSVTYDVGIFRIDRDEPAATGRFVHVWVERDNQRPTAIPTTIRAALQPLVVAAAVQ